MSLRDRHFGDLRPRLTALLVASGAVLLIACVNVAIMALLRALARRRELAIRLAIGAGRASIVRQLLIEAAVLATIGAAGGLLVAQTAISALVAFAPAGVPRLDEVGFNLPAALFTGAILVVVTLIVGLAPALVAANLRAFEGVIPSGRASDTRTAARLRDALTIVEVGLAAALVICAGLTLRSLNGLLHTRARLRDAAPRQLQDQPHAAGLPRRRARRAVLRSADDAAGGDSRRAPPRERSATCP